MNDALITFGILLVGLLWRAVTSYLRLRCASCAWCRQRDPPRLKRLQRVLCFLAWVPHWYTVIVVGIGGMVARTALGIYKWEVVEYEWLSTDRVDESLTRIPGMAPSERERLAIHDWLKCCAFAAPVVGVLAAGGVAVHAGMLAWYEAGRGRYCISYEVNLVLTVISMPLVFALMAMRAEVRMLAVMTGSAWQIISDAGSTQVSWSDLKASEMSMYVAELQEAAVFQCVTMWNIGALCVHYMTKIPPEYRHTLKWTGLQGIGFNIMAATMVSVGDMLAPTCALNKECAIVAAWWQDTGRPTLNPISMASSLLCVYNIWHMGSLAVVKEKLPRWNKQMFATKALVLCTQWQWQIIQGFTVGSWVYKLFNPALLVGYDFSPERAALLHAALLNVECFLVVCANFHMWDPKAPYTAEDGPSASQASAQDGRPGEAPSRAELVPKPPEAPVQAGCADGPASMTEPLLNKEEQC